MVFAIKLINCTSNKFSIHDHCKARPLDNIVVDNKFVSYIWHILSGDGNLNVKMGGLQIQLLNLAVMQILDQDTKKSCLKYVLVLL